MIKSLIKWLFRSEFDAERTALIYEAQDVLNETKRNIVKKNAEVKYINYERFEVSSESFLQGMQPVTQNNRVISWLNGHKGIYVSTMKDALWVGRKDDVLALAAQVMTIEALLEDLNDFNLAFINMLETKKEEQLHVTGKTES